MSGNPPLVILAAGKNSRFFPLNTTAHKGFIEICGQTLLARTIADAVRAGITNIILIVSPTLSARAKQLVPPKGAEIVVVEQKEPLGMGSALLAAQTHISGPFLLASPYHTSVGETLSRLLEKNKQSSATTILVGTPTKHPERYGIIGVSGDKVQGLSEKPEKPVSNLKISSVYLLDQSILGVLKSLPTSEYNFEVALGELIEQGSVRWIENPHSLPTLKYAWQLLDFKNSILEQEQTDIESSANIAKTAIIDSTKGPVRVSKNAQIGDFVKITGPAYIGAEVVIGEHSFIRESSIEARAVVGAYSEVTRSILLPDTTMHQSYCADSILGPGTTVGAGLITANKRLDGQSISCTVKGVRTQTDRKKLGLITGENVHLGVRVTAMPGTIVGASSTVFPNEQIGKSISENSTVQTKKGKL